MDLASASEIQTFMAKHNVKGPDTVKVDGKAIVNDWDDQLFIQDLYEDYLRAAQQSKIPLTMTFEQHLDSCVRTLIWRKTDLKREHSFDVIDKPTYDNAVMLADAAIEAIKQYLELPEEARLIRV